MRGRAVFVAGVAVGVLAVGTVPAEAAKPPVSATGPVRCAGVVRFRGVQTAYHRLLTPRADGATTEVELKGPLKCNGAAGGPGIRVNSVKLQGTLVRTWECTFDTLLTGVKQHRWSFNLKWRSSGGRLQPSTLTFTTFKGTPWLPPGPPAAFLDFPGSPTGTARVSGSYAHSSAPKLQIVFTHRVGTRFRILPFGWTDTRCHFIVPNGTYPTPTDAVLTL
jgi:hypothetical protein